MNRAWLDTETKAVLQKVPPGKLAPATTETFSVVVIDRTFQPIESRHLRAYHRVLGATIDAATDALKRALPLILKRELTFPDAMLAQFELICCDIISVFVSDTVISNADSNYLSELWNSLKTGDEFERLSVTIEDVPDDSAGADFLEQFVRMKADQYPLEIMAMRKKARIMQHWGKKIGVAVKVAGR